MSDLMKSNYDRKPEEDLLFPCMDSESENTEEFTQFVQDLWLASSF